MVTGQSARTRRWIGAGAVLLASVVCIGSVRAARVVPSETPLRLVDPAPAAPITALLPGLARVLESATQERFARVVAHDIDNDGDLDVVANTGRLELLVWENDGAGHLVRKPAARLTDLQERLLAVELGEPASSSEETSSHYGHDLRLERVHSSLDTAGETLLPARFDRLVDQVRLNIRSPRAPPLAFQLL